MSIILSARKKKTIDKMHPGDLGLTSTGKYDKRRKAFRKSSTKTIKKRGRPKGFKVSEATRKKISAAMKRYWAKNSSGRKKTIKKRPRKSTARKSSAKKTARKSTRKSTAKRTTRKRSGSTAKPRVRVKAGSRRA